MAKIDVLMPYLKPSSISKAIRHPRSAARVLLYRVFPDYKELSSAVGVSEEQFKGYMAEIRQSRTGIRAEADSKTVTEWSRQVGGMPNDLSEVLYALVRTLKPSVLVETGVASGESSSHILKAMDLNKVGQLYSIDLPASESIPTGWLIPNELRERWHLMLGRSSDLLPSLLESLGQIDIFLHDSDHSYKNQAFEYERAWPYIRNGGLLLSDDIGLSRAFPEFAKGKSCRSLHYGGRLGIIVK